jgi:hypothetical protein
MAYQATNPGPAVEITAPQSGTTYRGFQALTETTMVFISGGNTITEKVYPAFTMCPMQIDEIVSISGSIAAFTQEPQAGAVS